MQYSIIIAKLDPTIGSEIKKTRPCVVISPPELNNHLNTVVVAPLTTSPKAYPTRVPVVFQNKKVFIAVDQIRTLDKKRILEILPPISTQTIKKLKSVIQETFVA